MAARVREVAWAQSARDALDAVIGYIAQDSQQAAGRVLDAALRAGASLATFAERGRVVSELGDPTIREVFVHRYRLQYRIEDARVLVVTFLHGARDFATWQANQGEQ
jgi:toxin ParE1/3/4